MRLAGKRVLVTGAASGIGNRTAMACAAEGAAVAFVDIKPDVVQYAADTLPGPRYAFVADITDEAAVISMVRRVVAVLGGIDVLIACAGLSPPKTNILEISAADWRRGMEVNVTGTLFCCREVAKVMVPHSGASIITMASVAGERVNKGTSLYGVSKAAVIRLTRSIAVDLAPLGIRANVISPGPVLTPMFAKLPAAARENLLSHVPLARAAQPEEIASVAVFLASDAARFITAENLHVDGGLNSAGWS